MEKSKFFSQELLRRFFSALIIMPLICLSVYCGGLIFIGLSFVCVVFVAYEWFDIVKDSKKLLCWLLIGMVAISLPALSLVYLRNLEDGLLIIFFMILVVVLSDIGGYICGKTIGGPKLAASISPNKTWSGFFGGIIIAVLVSSFFYNNLVLSAVISIIAQMSDLVESKFKRVFGVKDSSNIIPGHGGVMDTIDGFFLTAPFMVIINFFDLI